MAHVLDGRDRWLVEELLRAAPTDDIALAILCGRYTTATRLLMEHEAALDRKESEEHAAVHEAYADRNSDAADLAEAYGYQGICRRFDQLRGEARLLRGRLPAADAAQAAEVEAAIGRLLAGSGDAPLAVRERLNALVGGVRPACLPGPLRALVRSVHRSLSILVRRRIEEEGRSRPAPGVDTRLWCLYHGPAAGVDPLRRVGFERFLERARSVVGDWGVKHGVTDVQFGALLDRMGLSETRHDPRDEQQTAELVEGHGALQARIGWWDGDAPHEARIVLSGVEGPVGARRFLALDPLLEGPSRYSMEDLSALEASVTSLRVDERRLMEFVG
jgi:hypothetical protein